MNVDTLNLAKNQAKSFEFRGKSVQGFLSYDRTNKQTNKQRSQFYI